MYRDAIMKLIYFLILLCGCFHSNVAAPQDAVSIMGEISYNLHRNDSNRTRLPPELDPDFHVPFLIRKEGYPAEGHTVLTEDNYLLTVFRIRGPEGSLPVFLQHGLLGSAGDWLFPGKGKALGFILAERGYDVWLGNYRGNIYSRGHVSLPTYPQSAKYWEFSWQECGYYDLPAMLTYVTNITNKRIEAYVGHSMGTTGFYVMASERPEFQEKVKIMFSVAPVAFMSHVKGATVMFAKHGNEIRLLTHSMGLNMFPPFDESVKAATRLFCGMSPALRELCKGMLSLFMGVNNSELDDEVLSRVMNIDPSGMAMKMFIHYAQEVQSGHFRKYDYGPEWNMKFYNSPEPPDYDISKITTPIVLIYADNDYLAQPEDVEILRDKLPNVVDDYRVPNPNYNHIDVIWGKTAPTLIFDRILQDIEKFNSGSKK